MTSTTAVRPLRTRPRVASVLLWVLQALLALVFLGSALSAFAGAAASVRSFGALGLGDWPRFVFGALYLLGAIGLVVPRVAGPAATGLAVIMLGALFTELFLLHPGAPALPLVLLVLLVVVAWFRRDQLAWWWTRLRAR